MKNILFALIPFLLISCGGAVQVPDDAVRRDLNEKTTRLRISEVIDSEIAADNKIQINGNSKSYEAIELIKFLVPLLEDRGNLSMGFWFTDGCSDEEILGFLNDEEGAPEAVDLLFKTDPVLAGFTPYQELLEGIKSFYQEIDNPEDILITSSDEAFVRFDLYERGDFDDGRKQYLIHSPLLNSRGRWEMPFQGQLYFMMIHDWLLENYRIIPMEGSVLEYSFLTRENESDGITAGSLMDGIILMGRDSSYTPFHRIEAFITEENIPYALEFFPKQIIREKTNPATYLVNKKVSGRHRRSSRKLEKLYSLITELEPSVDQ